MEETPTSLSKRQTPQPERLSRRAGILGVLMIALLFGAIIFGVMNRQGVNMRDPNDASRTDAATTAGRQISSSIPEGNLAAKPEPPLEIRDAPVVEQPPAPVISQPPEEISPEERLREEAYQRYKAALMADIPAASRGMMGDGGALSGVAPAPGDLGQLLNALGGSGGATSPNLLAGLNGSGNPVDDFTAQNNQSGKLEFNTASRDAKNNYLQASRNAALSPYEIKAGWDIPAVLDQGINSDLPGEIHATVRENVYDTATGKHLLIPQGSKVIGVYNSSVGYGQTGMQAVWTRVIFPDASSINLDRMVGQDAQGYSGFRDKVNNHWGKLIGGAVLSSLFSAGFQLSQNNGSYTNGERSSGEVAASAVGQEVTQLGMQITRRNLNIQPTIEIRPGYRFNIRVNKDMIFPGAYSRMAPIGGY